MTEGYSTWAAMIQRCHNPNSLAYPNYGGRGILVCEEWRGPGGFKRFIAHVGPRLPGTSIDRIDNDRGYEPGNVRWATRSVQRRNQRPRPHKPPELVLTQAEATEHSRRRRLPTYRQLIMMALIEAYTQVRRFPPSWRELMRLTGMRSTNSVNDHLKLMKLKGLVRYDQKTARSTVLTDFGREVVETCDSKWP